MFIRISDAAEFEGEIYNYVVHDVDLVVVVNELKKQVLRLFQSIMKGLYPLPR